MLTPMLVQYVVGLCCLRRNPEAVDVTVGDLVLDTAAGKARDVDITVTLQELDGIRAFKAYEVKTRAEPLDVVTVEQLCIKLLDMPAVSHRAIVSTSGFTNGAVAKASAHGVELFMMKRWDKPRETLAQLGVPVLANSSSHLLCWVDWSIQLTAPDGPRTFTYDNSAPLFASDGSPHRQFGTLTEYLDALLLRSTEILFPLEPARTISRTFPLQSLPEDDALEVSPAWPHTHTLDVEADDVFLNLNNQLARLTTVTITGRLQWQSRKRELEYHVLEQIPNGEPFAGAALAEWGTPDGKMLAWVFAPGSRTVGIHTIQLQAKHRHAIRNLKIPLPDRAP